MEKGSVFRAKYNTKWAGLILLVCPWLSYQVINRAVENQFDFWFLFIIIGVFWSLGLFAHVVGKIWKKIQIRHINIILKKVVHYHSMCITSLINEDYKRVEFILNECLSKYDSSSNITFFIRGALTIGTKDITKIKDMESDLKKIAIKI